jgi:hypothetical protein
MKIFIRNESTALYLTEKGTWADDLKDALLFPNVAKATQFLHQQKIAGAAVVLWQSDAVWETHMKKNP